MDEEWLDELGNEEETTIPPTGLGYRYGYLWIDGVRISPHDYPDCLERDEFDCNLCTFFTPKTCRLLRDPILMEEARTLFDIYREYRAVQRAAQLERQRALIHAVRAELHTHGRSLHYTVLARMVADRHPELQVSERSVLLIMAHHPDVFERVAEGVYQCRRKG